LVDSTEQDHYSRIERIFVYKIMLAPYSHRPPGALKVVLQKYKTDSILELSTR